MMPSPPSFSFLKVDGMPNRFDFESLGLGEASELHRLLRQNPAIEPRAYLDGEFLVRDGEDSQEVFIVLKGAFVVELAPVPPAARPTILASTECDLDHLAIVGEMSLLGTHRRSAFVRSVGKTLTLCLGLDHLEALLHGFPGLTRLLCQQFATRLRDTKQRLYDLQQKFTLNTHQRIVEPGEVLFRAGEPADTLYQAVIGTIRVERSGHSEVMPSDKLFLGFLEPGPFLRNQPQSATAIAEERCFLVGIGKGSRAPLIRTYPELAMHVLETE